MVVTKPRKPAHQYHGVEASMKTLWVTMPLKADRAKASMQRLLYCPRGSLKGDGLVNRERTTALRVIFFAVLLTGGCKEDSVKDSAPPVQLAAQPAAAELIFPEGLRVGDESVNQFVRTALTQCASGNYEAFRALWSAKRDPISRSEFEEGWHAVHRVEVRGLQKAILEADAKEGHQETVYALLVEVQLNPEARVGQRAPLREIVLMLVREHDQWRLAPAPKDMRDWIKKQVSPSDSVPSTAKGQP
jgi:hypothetical protein